MCFQVTMPRSARTVRSMDAGEGCGGGHLPIEDVGAGLGDDFLAGLGVEADGDLVAHGAAGDKQGGFAAEDLGGARSRRLTVGSSP